MQLNSFPKQKTYIIISSCWCHIMSMSSCINNFKFILQTRNIYYWSCYYIKPNAFTSKIVRVLFVQYKAKKKINATNYLQRTINFAASWSNDKFYNFWHKMHNAWGRISSTFCIYCSEIKIRIFYSQGKHGHDGRQRQQD